MRLVTVYRSGVVGVGITGSNGYRRPTSSLRTLIIYAQRVKGSFARRVDRRVFGAGSRVWAKYFLSIRIVSSRSKVPFRRRRLTEDTPTLCLFFFMTSRRSEASAFDMRCRRL